MSGDKKVFDAIFHRAVEWMADCGMMECRTVDKTVSTNYIGLHVSQMYFSHGKGRHFDLLFTDICFSVNRDNQGHVQCDDPMGAFDEFIEDCIKAR